MKNIFFACLTLCSFLSFGQAPSQLIDDLKDVIATNPSDSIKIKSYSDLCWYYRRVNTDSAFAYGDKALKLSIKKNNLLGEAQAYNDIGILHYDRANYKKALDYYRNSLKIRSKLKDSSGVAALYNKIGLVHQNTFYMDSAMYYASKALAIYTEMDNLRYAAVIKNNIANIQKGLKQYKQALNSHLEIAEINKRIKDSLALTRSYNNIANAYLFLKDTLNGVLYYKKGITLAKTKEYKRELAALYNNYAGILENQNRQNEAVDLTLKSLELRTELNDKQGVASTSLHLAGLYLNARKIDRAKKYLNKGVYLSKQIDANELKMDAYDKLTTYHAFKNNIDSVIYYKELYKLVRDSIFSKRVLKEVTEIQEKYNTAEREKEILSQRTQIAENKLDLTKKNTQIIGLSLIAILLSIFGYLLYKQQKLKNHQLKKESELKEALIKIETQNKLQEQRLRISRDLHDNIGAQLTFIISSIENLQYSFKITNDKLTNKLYGISTFTKDTIYELRDTVWAMNKDDISIGDLKKRITNFKNQADLKTTEIIFYINPSISEYLSFTSLKGMNIYRIIQEALNNAIKYAEANCINISIQKVDSNTINIEVKDDGKGFDINTINKGNGLNNMKKRAEEINTTISIESKLGEGTSINFIVKYEY